MIPDTIKFTKLNAGGNDFICIDNTENQFAALIQSPFFPDFVRRLCKRGVSIGADGLIVAGEIGDGPGIDICARFMEPDGSEAELCGNGTACFTWWAIGKNLVKGPELQILTAAGAARGKITDWDRRRVMVCVPDAHNLQQGIKLDVKGRKWELDFAVTGVPHAVTFVDHLQKLDVAHWGPGIRNHPCFAPRGANANFVQILEEGKIAVRTFEFGVEAETLACGTGSAASAILSCLRFDWDKTFKHGEKAIEVTVRGGDTLKVWFTCNDAGTVSDVCLEARVCPVYDGTVRPEMIRELLAAKNKA